MVDATDPGRGDPEAIGAAATLRSDRAERLRGVVATVTGALADASGGAWSGEAQTAFVTTLADTTPDLVLLADGLDAQSAALASYAVELRAIRDGQRALEWRRAGGETERARLAAELERARELSEGPMADLLGARPRVADLQDRLATARDEAIGIDAEWEALVERRRHADAVAAAALASPAVRGGLARVDRAPRSSPDGLMALVAGLSAGDLAVLLASRPALLAPLEKVGPERVAAWWAQLDGASRRALIAGAPLLIGRLGGVPPSARVAANRLNVRERLEEVEAALDDLRSRRAGVGRFSTPHANEDEIRLLQRERSYLKRVADGRVQLYLYDPESLSLIEMIGAPDEGTSRLLTYIPGTFTSLHSFYESSPQQVSRWIEISEPGTVAFIWKVGEFPGEDAGSGGIDLFRIGEANEQQRALERGELFAGFEHELHVAEPVLGTAQQTAIGHSWGLSVITASEVVGARYDHVVSLAGAGMPEAWVPDPSTRYEHFSYTDALSIVQATGVVWDGRIPGADPTFTSHIYGREGDFTWRIPSIGSAGDGGVPQIEVPLSTDPFGNHYLIASTAVENQKALEDLLWSIEE